jgi:predicted PurR-regulated permease PerM
LNSIAAIIKKHWQLLVFVLGLILVFWFIWALRGVFLPFIVGFILAYLLLPLIRWVERHLVRPGKRQKLIHVQRISIILVIYLLALIVIVLAALYIITLVGNAMGTLTQDTSQIIPNGLDVIRQWLKSSPLLANPSVQENIDVYMTKAEVAAPGVLNDFLTRGVKGVQASSSMILSFIIMPIFMFFILKDWERLREKMYAALPHWSRVHTKNIFSILQNVLGRYIRGQLLQSLAVGICAYLLLLFLRIEYALPLAVFAALTEVVPTVGPWLGGGLAVMVTLATAPEKIVWVALGFLVIQLLENSLLVPRIQSAEMEIHPAFILILTLLGAHFAGLVGFIIILPLTMTVMKIYTYLRDSTREGSVTSFDQPEPME